MDQVISIVTQEEESLKKGISHTPSVNYLSHGSSSKVGGNSQKSKKKKKVNLILVIRNLDLLDPRMVVNIIWVQN